MPRRLTTEEFIEKARATHGDRYSYGRAVYVRSTGKITITCHEHGDFEQEACSHLQGAGCAKCSGNAKLTTEDFIEQAREVHGDRYGYARSIYTSTMKKIIITCPEHGYFLQTPDTHLRGSGCPTCGLLARALSKTLTTEEFIEKARATHGDKYGYGRTVYRGMNNKVTITCPEHGDFLQTSRDHSQGKGCIKCATTARVLSKTLTTEKFIKRARLVHGSKYNYGRTDYIRNLDKITITCPDHGDFSQLPGNHLAGKGCVKCSGTHSHTTDEFIEKARGVHDDKYNYDRTVYVSNKEKATITCPEHGDFQQTPSKHLQGQGCSKCSITGFNPARPAYLYVLLDPETYSRVKIGISNQPDTRLRDLKRDTPFAIERIDLFETPSEITLQIEKFCHSQLESCGPQGFNGATEWFKFDGATLEALRVFIRSCGGVPR